mmetsp:Transcript_8303/g.26790  ORF Transcript_8303/g.26790 Transcript_8303/m.26790 type:complete len:210 (-) Transcript_8303:493-1122(-)
MKYGMSRHENSVMRNSSRAVGTKSTFHPLARIVMIMSRYSSVKEARGSMTVLILSLSMRKPWSSMNSVCGPSWKSCPRLSARRSEWSWCTVIPCGESSLTSRRLVCVACAASEPSALDSYSIGAASAYDALTSLCASRPRSSSQPKKESRAYPSLWTRYEYFVLMCGIASTHPCMGETRSGSGSSVTFFHRASTPFRSMFAHDSKFGKV